MLLFIFCVVSPVIASLVDILAEGVNNSVVVFPSNVDDTVTVTFSSIVVIASVVGDVSVVGDASVVVAASVGVVVSVVIYVVLRPDTIQMKALNTKLDDKNGFCYTSQLINIPN